MSIAEDLVVSGYKTKIVLVGASYILSVFLSIK